MKRERLRLRPIRGFRRRQGGGAKCVAERVPSLPDGPDNI